MDHSLCRRPATSARAWILVLPLLLLGCGPVAIGAAIASGGGGSSSTQPPLAIDQVSIDDTGAAGIGGCGLIREVRLRVSRPNVALTYSLNGGAFGPFTDPNTRVAQPAPDANAATVRRVLLVAGSNTLVVRASVGNETVEQTLTVTLAVDPIVIDLEPPDVRGQGMTLRWSMALGDETFFWIFFDDAGHAIDDLAGTANEGTSPLRVDVGALNPSVVDGRRRYSFDLTGLANSPDGYLQHHYFAVRANDGCESRVVTAHTRPKPQRLSWPTAGRTDLLLRTVLPNTANTAPPVGGPASADDVVGMPPLLVDRGGDSENASQAQELKETDGLEEVAYISRDGYVYCSLNDAGQFDPPLRVDDAGAGSTGEMIRAFTFDNDDDLRADLFVLTAQRLWAYAADAVVEGLDPEQTRFLNWKKVPAGVIDLPMLPPGIQFLDAWHGDFDGDGTPDIVTSVGRPPTASENGEATRIYVWYGDRNTPGFAQWNWSTNPPLEIEIDTLFGDDGYFIVGDVDNDGRDDLLTLLHVGATDVRFRILLQRGRGVPPQAVLSGNVYANPNDPAETLFTSIETARWDQTALVDLNHDGVLDILSLRSRDVFSGAIVSLRGYLTDLQTLTVSTNTPYVNSPLDSTHPRIENPRQRGHLQILDLDNDGIFEVLLRSVQGGTPFVASRVSIYRGVVDPQTGLQNWPALSLTPQSVDFQRQANEAPHLHFAAADLNFDGVLDLCAVHERPTTSAAVIMPSSPEWEYERFAQVPAPNRYALGGTMRTGGGATTVQIGQVARAGDLVVGVDPVLGVAVLPAAADAGAKNGAFQPVRRVPLQAPLPSLRQFEVVQQPATSGDILVLQDDGRIGTLEYQRPSDSYALRDEIQITGITQFYAAYFDNDRRADALVIDANNMMYLLGTVDAAGGHDQDLAIRDMRQLASQPELVATDSITDSPFSEVLVVLQQSGSEVREVHEYRVLRDNGTGKARFYDAPTMRTFPTRIVSLATANFSGRFETNLGQRKWLVGGTADGRLLTVRGGETNAIELPPGIGPIGSGEIEVFAADVTNDNLPDVIAYERGTSRLVVLRCQPDTEQIWRFPTEGYHEFQGAGVFDSPVVVPIPEPLSALSIARIDNDPYNDLLLLSADGERVHVFVTRGAQLRLE